MPCKLSRTSAILALTLALGLSGCVESITLPEEPIPGELSVGEVRTVELRFLRFDVKNYEQALDLAALRKLPRKTLQESWLLDYDLTGPVQTVLRGLTELPPEEVEKLSPAARNMRKLLTMTADSVRLEGTKLEDMIALAGAVGLPPAKVLAAMMQSGVTEPAIPFDIVADVFLELLVGSHPNSKKRSGAVNKEHPDGLYDVTPKSLAVSLDDIVWNFDRLAERFGPVGDHPGFIRSASGGVTDFTMRIRANLNALPYKGVDLTSSYIASVNSIGSQIEHAFDFEDPEWMQVEGLQDSIEIEEMTMTLVENDDFVAGGDSKAPTPWGNSAAWDLPDWEFEHLIIETARRRTMAIGDHCDTYELGTGVEAFEACVDGAGWTEMTTFTDIGNPPPPAYFWDILAEVAQVRLHDPASPGDAPIAEGDADVEFTLRNLDIPLDQKDILGQIRANLAANPKALTKLAELLNDNSDGDADFYYYRPTAAAVDDDYLYFVTADDLRTDADGEPVRPYNYAHPGFYADADLKKKLSRTTAIDGDDTHEKLRVSPGQVVFVEDDAGHVFQIGVGDKPNRSTLSLALTRVR